MIHSKVVSETLDHNLETMKYIFHADVNADIILREFDSGYGKRCFLAYIDGMANQQFISDFILRPLLLAEKGKQNPAIRDYIQMSFAKNAAEIDEVTQAVLVGDTVIFEEGSGQAVICETKGFASRSVSEPTAEVVVKGSQEGFNEVIRTNVTLIRRIIKNSQLCTEFIQVGDVNQNLCAVVYLDDLVNKDVLTEVKRRLNLIKGDFIMGSGMIEQMIEDKPFSLFPSILSTERPDRVASYLADGRVAVVCDGSPFVIVVPVSISLLLDSPEGASARWTNGTFPRIIRMLALLCTTMLSGVYLALVIYHREMIPTQLLGAIVAAQANVPFPVLLEVLLMEFAFELVREAGLRTPNALGGAIGIVGALILGQSAVEANLVSPVTLIIVALSGLGNTVIPDYDLAFGLRMIKIFFIFLGAILGFLGIAIAIVLVITILANQRSFGVPMLSMQTLKWGAGSPLFFQWPVWKQRSRPREVGPQKSKRFPDQARAWEHGQKEE